MIVGFNGAAFARTRKDGSRRSCAQRERLQWGRVRENAEGRCSCAAVEARSASMGPRSRERGRFRSDGTALVLGVLQWGRVRENAEGPLEPFFPPTSRGFNGAAFARTRKGSRPVRRATSAPRFNGAAFARTRKAMDVTRAAWGRRCFNGAAFARTRKGVAGCSPACASPGFNGAAFARTRKVRHVLHHHIEARASMGPRSRERGRRSHGSEVPERDPASMGPRSRERGRPRRRPPSSCACRASMGPRSRERGRPTQSPASF